MNVIKRNGTKEQFDVNKIATALYKVYMEIGDRSKTKKLCKEQAKVISAHYLENNKDIDIELIQDDVENYLMETKQFLAAKAFIKYREKKAEERKNPWKDNDERQDLILQKYLLKGETKKQFLERISFGNSNLEKIFRKREAIWGGRNLYAIGREGNITGSNCFVKGTKVLTSIGYQDIDKIRIGEKVLTSDGSYQLVNEVMSRVYNEDLVVLESKYFKKDITTTKNHQFLTQKGWVCADDLLFHKKGSHTSPHFIKFKKSIINSPVPVLYLDMKKELSHIINEKFILDDCDDINKYQPKVKHDNKGTLVFTKSTINPINRIIELDSDLAYVFGRFLGDGSITKRKDTKHNLFSIWQIVGHEKEKDELDRCADIIENKFGVSVNRHFSTSLQKTYFIRVDNIALCEFFNKYVGHSFDKKFIHENLMRYPAVLYGLFDSDGSIDQKGNGNITLNNKLLIQQLKNMLDYFGIPSYITKKINAVKKYGDYPMLYIPRNALSLFIDNISKKYDDNRKSLAVAKNNGYVRIIDGEAYIQLDNKRYIKGNQEVYNISVEVNHDYVVDNVHVHNCYVTRDPEDNLEDIYRADYEIARTYSYGGGQGMNLSKLRPKGAKVNNSSNTTPGIMVFAEKYSHTTLNTQQESRRGALMLVLNIDHPDVVDFITAKLDLNKINGANISLAITDKFMQAYMNDDIWEMSFETKYEIIKKTMKARDLMSLISYAANTIGDPGVIFIDTMNKYHLLSEYDEVKFTATNPCKQRRCTA